MGPWGLTGLASCPGATPRPTPAMGVLSEGLAAPHLASLFCAHDAPLSPFCQ